MVDAFLVLGVHRALIGGHVRHQRFHGVLDLVGDAFGLVAGAGIPVNLESGIVFHLARGQRRVGHCRGEAQGLRFASGQRDAGPLQAVLRRVVLEAARTLGAAVLIGQPRPNRIGHAGVARGRLALVFHDQRVHNLLSDLDLRRRIGICALHHVQARRRGVGARLVHGRGARLARLGQPAAGFARIVGRILEEHGVVDEGAVLHGLVVGHRHGELHLLGVVFAHLEVLQHPLDVAVCRDVNAAVFHALEFSVDGYVVAHPHEVCLGLAGVHGAQGVLDGAVGRDLAIGGRVGRLVDGHLGLVGRRRRPVHRVRHRAGCLRGVDVSVRPVVLPVRRVGDDRIVGHIAVHCHVKAHGHAAAVSGNRQIAPLDARLAGGRHGAPVAFARNAADHERRILGNLVAYAHVCRIRVARVRQRDVVGDLVAALHVRTRRRVCSLGRRQLHRLVQRMLDNFSRLGGIVSGARLFLCPLIQTLVGDLLERGSTRPVIHSHRETPCLWILPAGCHIRQNPLDVDLVVFGSPSATVRDAALIKRRALRHIVTHAHEGRSHRAFLCGFRLEVVGDGVAVFHRRVAGGIGRFVHRDLRCALEWVHHDVGLVARVACRVPVVFIHRLVANLGWGSPTFIFHLHGEADRLLGARLYGDSLPLHIRRAGRGRGRIIVGAHKSRARRNVIAYAHFLCRCTTHVFQCDAVHNLVTSAHAGARFRHRALARMQ